MRSRGSDAVRRTEVEGAVEKAKSDMRDHEQRMESRALDWKTVQRTMERLGFRGTQEGEQAVREHIEKAADVTVECFRREDADLDRLLAEDADRERDNAERADSVKEGMNTLRDMLAELKGQEAIGEAEGAHDAAQVDLEFWNAIIERAREARQDTERVKQKLNDQVGRGGKK